MAREYVGTTRCPQPLGWYEGKTQVCPNKANVYKLDDHPDSYTSECTGHHKHFFGGYYLENVDQEATEIEIPPEVV
jgi:hypothetical protein